LDAGEEAEARAATYTSLLQRIARAGGEAPGVAASWLEAFSAGTGEWEAVCGATPGCVRCPLASSCAFLAGGGKEERQSGQALARALTDGGGSSKSSRGAAEVLAFVLSGGVGGAGQVARAEALLRERGGVREVLSAPVGELRALGLEKAELARLRAVAEILRHYTSETRPRGAPFRTAQDFFERYHLRLRDQKEERFFVLCLDQKHRLVGEEMVSLGSATEALVHPREVFAPAVRRQAAAVAVVHNHPSGDPEPSSADRTITTRLREGAQLLGIRFLDHVIVGEGRYFSFAEQGLL
jgi:DNA repair protein RadC